MACGAGGRRDAPRRGRASVACASAEVNGVLRAEPEGRGGQPGARSSVAEGGRDVGSRPLRSEAVQGGGRPGARVHVHAHRSQGADGGRRRGTGGGLLGRLGLGQGEGELGVG